MSLDAAFGAALLLASGQIATYTPSTGPAVQTRAYVAWETVHIPDGYASQRAESRLIAYLPAKDIAEPRTTTGTITIGATAYVIDDIHEQDQAVVAYVVRRQ